MRAFFLDKRASAIDKEALSLKFLFICNMKHELEKYAYRPMKQNSNRVWRTYKGGALIDRWNRANIEIDNDYPEEWIMSAITARGDDRPPNEGLTMIDVGDHIFSLNDLIDSNPALYLGKKLADKYGTTGVLIKMLDSMERLTIQVHPDKHYAQTVLNSEFGKTESWYVLDTREIDGEKPSVYMGFKKHVTRELWQEHFETQNIEGMLDCLHKFEVKPGDAFMIYGGVPHAIGSGCFLMEVQEPTDYTMRVEKVTPNGLEMTPKLIHQGVGEEKMLDCFHYDTYTEAEATNRWRIEPQVIDQGEGYTFKTLFNEKHTDCFGLSELTLDGAYELKSNESFQVAVIYSGQGKMTCNEEVFDYQQGDKIFISAAIDQLHFQSEKASKILLCYPPIC